MDKLNLVWIKLSQNESSLAGVNCESSLYHNLSCGYPKEAAKKERGNNLSLFCSSVIEKIILVYFCAFFRPNFPLAMLYFHLFVFSLTKMQDSGHKVRQFFVNLVQIYKKKKRFSQTNTQPSSQW